MNSSKSRADSQKSSEDSPHKREKQPASKPQVPKGDADDDDLPRDTQKKLGLKEKELCSSEFMSESQTSNLAIAKDNAAMHRIIQEMEDKLHNMQASISQKEENAKRITEQIKKEKLAECQQVRQHYENWKIPLPPAYKEKIKAVYTDKPITLEIQADYGENSPRIWNCNQTAERVFRYAAAKIKGCAATRSHNLEADIASRRDQEADRGHEAKSVKSHPKWAYY